MDIVGHETLLFDGSGHCGTRFFMTRLRVRGRTTSRRFLQEAEEAVEEDATAEEEMVADEAPAEGEDVAVVFPETKAATAGPGKT